MIRHLTAFSFLTSCGLGKNGMGLSQQKNVCTKRTQHGNTPMHGTSKQRAGLPVQSSLPIRHQVMFLRLLSGKVKEGHKTLYAMKEAWHGYMTLDLKKLAY